MPQKSLLPISDIKLARLSTQPPLKHPIPLLPTNTTAILTLQQSNTHIISTD
jgi:hypothetical protein